MVVVRRGVGSPRGAASSAQVGLNAIKATVPRGEDGMERDLISTHWASLKGRVRNRWRKLTEDDLEEINGSRRLLILALQRRYGAEPEAIELDLRDFEDEVPLEPSPGWDGGDPQDEAEAGEPARW